MFEIIVFLPLVGFLIAGLFGKFIGDRASEVITTSFVVLCAVLSWIGFFTSGGREVNINIIPWLQIADLNFSWSLYIDHLSPIKKAKSPTRLTIKALIAALFAESRVNQNPINK